MTEKEKKNKINLDVTICFGIIISFVFVIIYSDGHLSQGSASAADIILNTSQENIPTERANEPSVRLMAVGDIMLSRAVDAKMLINGTDYPFEKTKQFLNSGDIVFGNLESPIFPGEIMPSSSTVFWARPGIEKKLKESGFDVLSLANNHMGNQGSYGVNYTVHSLTKEGILTVGGGRDSDKAKAPAIIEKNGIRLAFLAYTDGSIIPDSYEASPYNPGVVYLETAKLSEDIKKAKEVADFVIVSMHTGTEYVYRPNKEQIDFARSAIDNGAELVIGQHPHSIQDVEEYKGKYIFYSLGNFIFDQMWSTQTREGMIAEINFSKQGVVSYNLIPVRIDDFAQPNSVDAKESEKILSNIVR